MNITFLIGNGFDRNLGLDTTYSDFIKVYKNRRLKLRHLKNFVHTLMKMRNYGHQLSWSLDAIPVNLTLDKESSFRCVKRIFVKIWRYT